MRSEKKLVILLLRVGSTTSRHDKPSQPSIHSYMYKVSNCYQLTWMVVGRWNNYTRIVREHNCRNKWTATNFLKCAVIFVIESRVRKGNSQQSWSQWRPRSTQFNIAILNPVFTTEKRETKIVYNNYDYWFILLYI